MEELLKVYYRFKTHWKQVAIKKFLEEYLGIKIGIANNLLSRIKKNKVNLHDDPVISVPKGLKVRKKKEHKQKSMKGIVCTDLL